MTFSLPVSLYAFAVNIVIVLSNAFFVSQSLEDGRTSGYTILGGGGSERENSGTVDLSTFDGAHYALQPPQEFLDNINSIFTSNCTVSRDLSFLYISSYHLIVKNLHTSLCLIL